MSATWNESADGFAGFYDAFHRTVRSIVPTWWSTRASSYLILRSTRSPC